MQFKDFQFIPEFYYDFMARILPGLFLLVSIFISYQQFFLQNILIINPILIIIGSIILSYYLSIFLHEVYIFFKFIRPINKGEIRKKDIVKDINKISLNSDKSIYILNRLMRAMAEIDASESLCTGLLGLAIFNAVLGFITFSSDNFLLLKFIYSSIYIVFFILSLSWRGNLIKASEELLDINKPSSDLE